MIYTTEILKDRFWILECSGVKLGTIRLESEDKYEVNITKDDVTVYDKQSLMVKYGKDILIPRKDSVSKSVEYGKDIDNVSGYPTKHKAFNKSSINVNEKSIPVYTKSEKSKVLYAAGYYGLNFENKAGWKNAYCVKAETLNTYEFIGPFRGKSELEAEISRL